MSRGFESHALRFTRHGGKQGVTMFERVRRTLLGKQSAVDERSGQAAGDEGQRQASAPGKVFAVDAADMVDFGLPDAACLATDRITVDGAPVGFAQRDHAQHGPEDSGWRFFAGDEDEAYLDDPGHSGVYSLNAIANCDDAIVPVVDAPRGTAWIRDGEALVSDPDGFQESSA
ncbi:DUF2185 domain-containing protein [Frondihabitans cladoniiphilus]|uniref:Immunity protein Imm33 domain-containing protein n=1 Tax=Frondihabitans cladoniiphilus TaxID=715785 RepID=A0ABP8W4E7_9MICO